MVRCHLSRLMGERKMRIVNVAQAAQINRSTVAALYHERATRVELEVVDRLCRVLGCSVGDLFEVIPKTDRKSKKLKH